MLGLLALGLALDMYISCCLYQFRLRWVANANPVFSGIWAIPYLEGGYVQRLSDLQFSPFVAPLTVVKDWSLKRHTCCILRTWPSCLTSSCCFWPVYITNSLLRAGWYSCRFENMKYLQDFIPKYLLLPFKIQLIKTLIHDPSQRDTKKL